MELDTIVCADCFDFMATIPDQSIDAIITDPPYGTTKHAWDAIVPFEPMWEAFERVIKPRGAIAMTASQPFTSALVMSNPGMFRYEWIWHKPRATQFMNVNHRPLKAHESILVFSLAPSVSGAHAENAMHFYPERKQVQRTNQKERYINRRGLYTGYNVKQRLSTVDTGNRYPKSIVMFDNGNSESLHPTQKPVALWAYLIKTYTQPGETILDPFCGSGTTAVACRQTGRHFLCADSSQDYVDMANRRFVSTDAFLDRQMPNGQTQLSLFSKE